MSRAEMEGSYKHTEYRFTSFMLHHCNTKQVHQKCSAHSETRQTCIQKHVIIKSHVRKVPLNDNYISIALNVRQYNKASSRIFISLQLFQSNCVLLKYFANVDTLSVTPK